ncbi:MAG: amidase [Acetobacterales bacterium]
MTGHAGEELHNLTIAALSEMIRGKSLSPVELTEYLLRRVEAFEPQLHAFVTLTADIALAQARAAEAEIMAGRWRGPLHGVPFALKDIYSTAGILTTAGSRILGDNVPDRDATTTARLLSAGGVLLGKLKTHEFAHGGPSFDVPWAPARNPWNVDHFTGGSSSGSGAAVAAGYVPSAMGSDTGGSIRNPGSLCGLVGFKPTYGIVSRAGVIPNSYSFDTCGPLTRSVEDAAILLNLLAGHDDADPASVAVPPRDYRAAVSDADVRGLRVGVLRHFWEEDLPANDEVRAAMERAITHFTDLGCFVEDARIRPLQDFYDVKVLIAEPEMFEAYAADLRSRVQEFGLDFLGRCLPACMVTATDYMAAQRERRRMNDEMRLTYDRYDILLTAGPYGPAPRIDAHSTMAFWKNPSVNTPFNVTGGPAIVLPMGLSASELPLSLQLTGRPFDDVTVLRAARAYERSAGFDGLRPPLDPDAPPVLWNGPRPQQPEKADISPGERDVVAAAARRHGLTLDDVVFEQICCAAPHILAMSERVGARTAGRFDEPANVFLAPR